MHNVKKAEYLEDYKILLTFEDKLEKVVDFDDALDHFEGEIFQPLKNLEFFKSFKVNSEVGAIVWPNDADVSPDYLYQIGKLL